MTPVTRQRPDLAGAAVGIWGFGKEGQSLARTAAAAGAARIDAVDDAGRGTLDAPSDIANLNLWRGAEHLNRLTGCDVVFLSPGIPWHQPFFAELRDAGTTLSSAADWYLRRYAAQTVGVTGTKGKSTTASFLTHLLCRLGADAVVAGNIGTPLSDLEPGPEAVVVAELSSQQCALVTASPRISVITNLFEDHLDWHGDIDAYHRAKANVFACGGEVLVTTPQVRAVLDRLGIALPPVVRSVDAADVEPPEGDYVMAYEHNVVNGALAAVAAAEVIGRPVTADEFLGAVTTFEALPHRLQVVRRTGEVRWIDDTLATTGESVVAALRSMRPDDRVALIVGGMDRQLDYEQIDDYLLTGARDVHLIQGPTNGAEIGRRFAAAHPESVHPVDSLQAAVRTAAAVPGVTAVLLSPGAASYDLFANYVAKAAAFCEFIDAETGVSDAVSQSN
ncbi:UDP-N-acetylmuramoyl-L-alanine--D-glutamate ligase [Mycolicibacterium sp. CBMA 226]|uniref:UDP-N-acetylmuramoyl-L-alanine--D-glutamate ligase n=1 Tax=Mycolicibacterium sp. CBMA 226 TaxID=2606611 RepID=UPI0012DE0949|nr:UDP-N-acetylmuramoyl-L-alanine--D-glutamate ligase [Mycolicibacterium sp. CBMA 226]